MFGMDELMGDRDFFMPMQVWRRTITYDPVGNAVDTGSFISPAPYGCIQSGANPEVLRQADMAVAENLISIVTSFRLTGDGDKTNEGAPQVVAQPAADLYGNIAVATGRIEYRADVILWRGDPFEIVLVQDWTHAGNGFVEAVARKVSRGQAALG